MARNGATRGLQRGGQRDTTDDVKKLYNDEYSLLFFLFF